MPKDRDLPWMFPPPRRTKPSPKEDTKKIDLILEAAKPYLEDYQLANLAEFLEGELHQKATRY